MGIVRQQDIASSFPWNCSVFARIVDCIDAHVAVIVQPLHMLLKPTCSKIHFGVRMQSKSGIHASSTYAAGCLPHMRSAL